jgi:hypothetical protein
MAVAVLMVPILKHLIEQVVEVGNSALVIFRNASDMGCNSYSLLELKVKVRDSVLVIFRNALPYILRVKFMTFCLKDAHIVPRTLGLPVLCLCWM